jgi:dTDP-L-rhamnose 4-epimerase
MAAKILITGGAGFIGSHLADRLLENGYSIRALDNLCPQVHGRRVRPGYLNREVELVSGDIRDPDVVRRALAGVHAVIHLAATAGVGQSMYEIAHFTSINATGTAVLLEELARRPVEKLVVASSMSVYGEGLYRTTRGDLAEGVPRPISQLRKRDWEVRDSLGDALIPIPTPESKTPAPPSVYAISKLHQERLCLTVGNAYGIPTVALRLFNVYGPRQALSNPYTGVLAIFAVRYLNGKRPQILEDGEQRRDFLSVHDAVNALKLALENREADGQVLNIGSGRSHTIREAAESLGDVLGVSNPEPDITGEYRIGDIRNCLADISLARIVLGYEPRVRFEEGLLELAGWLEGRTPVDRSREASAALESRGLRV